jgi:hypothetical protein
MVVSVLSLKNILINVANKWRDELMPQVDEIPWQYSFFFAHRYLHHFTSISNLDLRGNSRR